MAVRRARYGRSASSQIGNARGVAVAVLEVEIHHPANDKRRKIVVAVVCGHDHFVENVHEVEDLRVGHQRQVKEFFDFSAFVAIPRGGGVLDNTAVSPPASCGLPARVRSKR
jgi:hypothetical protein